MGWQRCLPLYKFLQEESPTERASVSAISLRYILASPGYAHGTIAVNVTWMEREFNAGQTHSSIYPSVFNRLRAIETYWSEIATFAYHLAFRGVPIGIPGKKFGPQKTRIMELSGCEDKSLTIGWAVSTQYQRVTDRRTDKQADVQPIAKTCAVWLTHIKNVITIQSDLKHS